MLIPILVVVLLIGLLAFAGQRELFRIEVRAGKQTVVRGQVPSGLLHDFGAALRHVQRGEVRAHRTGRGARLSFRGQIDEGVAQRLRNIFGLYPMAKLTARELDKSKLVSDAFTVSWLLSIVRGWFRW